MDFQATTPDKRKRSWVDDDAASDKLPAETPTALKKRKLDLNAESPSTPKALHAIKSALSGVFGYGRQQASQPSGDRKGGSKPPTAQPDPTKSGIENSTTITTTAPAPSPTPTKARPAVKLAALRGTKWDTGESPRKTPKKPPTPRHRATSKTGTPNTNGKADRDQDDETADYEYPENSPSKSVRTNGAIGQSPALKGILTPTKNRGPRQQKNVTFNGKGDSEVFFEDLPKTVSAKKSRTPSKPRRSKKNDVDDIVCALCIRGNSVPPNEIILCDNCDFAVHVDCYQLDEVPTGDWLCKSCTQEDVLKPPTKPDAAAAPVHIPEIPDIQNLDLHVRGMQRVLLGRCAGKRRIRQFGQDMPEDKVRQLLTQTVVAGEGNSMLLIGPRGCGKTAMVETVVADLSQEHRHEFHMVRLNGFIHTDDKLALREIWRQLGKEMKVDDDLLNRSNYADTMASLLALLSHPSEILATEEGVTSQSVVFVIDEFDLFAMHPRQTLLYNLFDIAQSRKAPIAVLGCTTRLDAVEMLEKRVKSRFSHRYVYLSLPKTLPAFWQVCRQGLIVDKADAEAEGIDVSLEGYDEFRKFWSSKIDELYKYRSFQDLLHYHYYTTKSAAGFFSEWMLPLSRLSAKDLSLAIPTIDSELTSLTPPDSRLHLLNTLSELDLGLLIAAARLEIVTNSDSVNFAMAYDEYGALVGRQRVQTAAAGLMAVGGNLRVWSRGVAGVAWERLVSFGLLVPAGVGGARTLGHGGLDGKMWKVDVALEEIPTAVKLNAAFARWCKEI